jgi:hypothetical protein
VPSVEKWNEGSLCYATPHPSLPLFFTIIVHYSNRNYRGSLKEPVPKIKPSRVRYNLIRGGPEREEKIKKLIPLVILFKNKQSCKQLFFWGGGSLKSNASKQWLWLTHIGFYINRSPYWCHITKLDNKA